MFKSNLDGKKLLILGGIPLSKEVVKYGKQLGLKVYVTDYLENSPAKKVADKSFMTSTTNVEALSELIQNENIDGLITGFVDMLLPFYEKACKINNLPCYLEKHQIDILTDKIKFKKLCRDFAIPVVEEYFLNNITDNEQINTLEFPVLLKPADNSGGRGITICRTLDQFYENYTKTISFSKTKQVLVEKYMQCKEVTIFYYIQNGNAYLTAMGDRHVQYFKDGLIPLPVAYTFPSVHLNEYERNIHPKVADMFHHLKMKDGIVFIQSFVKDGKCIFYEIGYRLTGSLEYKIIDHATGFNPMKMMLEYAITGQSNPSIKYLANPFFKKTYCNITFLANPGVIGSIRGVEQIKEMDQVLDIVLSYGVGDEIPQKALGTLAQVVARVFAYADTKIELISLMDNIHKEFYVLEQSGANMLLPVFDTLNIV